MQKSKLFQFLQTLTNKERRRFLRYIRSPYFNTDPQLVQLTEILLEADLTSLSRESLDQALFPGEAFDYFRISNLLSYLTRHLQQFWVQERQDWNHFPQQQHYLTELRERNLSQSFQQESKKLRRKLEQETLSDETIFYQQQWLEQELDSFFLAAGNRTDNESLLHRVEALDRYYVLSMLKSMCQLVNRQQILQTGGIPYLQEAFTQYLQKHHTRYAAFPLIGVYYEVLLSFTSAQADQHYQQVRDWLKAFGPQVKTDELQTLYQYARNFCIRQSNQGREGYLTQLFELYQEMLERELLYPEGYLSQGDLKNIVSLGIRLQEFSWTEHFLQEQSGRLLPEQRENALRYNQAQLAYAKGNYREARRQLVTVAFEDVFYYPGAKTLLLKIYFEQEEEASLETLLRTFRTWLKRDKLLSPVQKETHHNLIQFTQKLQKLRNQAQASGKGLIQTELAVLQQSLAQTRAISQKKWLAEQVQMLLIL